MTVLRLILISFLFVSVMFISCASHPKYPEEWKKPVVSKDGCVDISGTYSNTSDLGSGYLSRIIENMDVERINQPTHVTIYYPESDILSITAWAGDTPIAAKTHRKDQIKCTDEGIELSLGFESESGGLAAAFSFVDFTLNKTEDGYLLVIYESDTFYIIGPGIPLAGTSSYYSRFPPVEVNTEY